MKKLLAVLTILFTLGFITAGSVQAEPKPGDPVAIMMVCKKASYIFDTLKIHKENGFQSAQQVYDTYVRYDLCRFLPNLMSSEIDSVLSDKFVLDYGEKAGLHNVWVVSFKIQSGEIYYTFYFEKVNDKGA